MKKGFTLVELILSLALLSVVLLLVFNIYFLGKNIFDRSVHERGMQGNVRIAVDKVTEEIRTADFITSEVPEDGEINGKDEYYSIEIDGDELIKTKYPENEEEKSIATLSDILFKPKNGGLSLKISRDSYEIETEIPLENNPSIDIDNEGTHVIYYTKR
ncbi:prepilin-type N-terminal cleavage/methylation domain-containing protein [Sporanaerobacter sp. PP17-6a]|uniref:prepilin-type N-terminal cleavage/methylation domain-containing protein n=1 Tax=Sporanaerobacter sp. PP17-6a TaxID=1891289 RepID=UPI0008DAE078|nr:prepilin-type N-terminal cleavage/methylation domain-containing protein [Sporanaerobacter sp. PP17-6a]